jgi:hypothetical protein
MCVSTDWLYANTTQKRSWDMRSYDGIVLYELTLMEASSLFSRRFHNNPYVSTFVLLDSGTTALMWKRSILNRNQQVCV